ncbi:MAG: hypothetical protein ACR2QS_13635 [Woeseiaceae bacterium]
MSNLLKRVARLGLPDGDFAIFGSGPLLVRGIIDATNDIDIICRGPAWEKAVSIGEKAFLPDYDVEIVSIDDGAITLGRSWGIGDFDTNELIDSAEMIDGLPFVQINYVIDYKRIAGRSKDLQHLELIKQHGLLLGA